ncbi:DUF6298 domain-containing protein [Phocaeicola dorei]|nr:DUF6298 domain-containing protein [Phocaeicola dorei]
MLSDKRIFVADMFYDISHPVRRELHRKYIRQCLDNFADDANVVQLISAEFTRSVAFCTILAGCDRRVGERNLVRKQLWR